MDGQEVAGPTARGARGQGPAQEPAQRAAAPAGPGRRPAGAKAPAQRRPVEQPAPQRPAPAKPAAARPGVGRVTPSGIRDDVVSDQLADRLAERTAMARYRMWRRIGWTALALAVTAGLVWVVFFSPLLALDPEQVQVSGQGTTVDVAQVREAATDEAGVPLPRIDTVGLREEILAMNAVKNVEITRAWPDGLR